MFSRLKHDTCKKVQSTGRSISEHFPDWKCLSFNILWGIFNFSYDIKIDKRYSDGWLKQPNLVYLEMTISNEILQWPHQEDDDDDSHNHQLQLSNISVMVQCPLSHHSEAIISISPKSWSSSSPTSKSSPFCSKFPLLAAAGFWPSFNPDTTQSSSRPRDLFHLHCQA